ADAEWWFFEVGVVHLEGRPAAVGTPAVVPEPPSRLIPPLAGPALGRARPGDALAATAASFLRALLTGSGEVARYLAPRTAIAPVSPPPFAAVEVERTALVETTPDRSVLRVEALSTTAGGTDLRLVYELTLEQRGGRWEVRHLSGAPTLRHANPPPPDRATTTVPATDTPPTPPTTSSPTPGA
ncbi:MAG: conjugal transfer protein, partial [Actinobacteria bacterium]|nr:conjugal transfer protein [Actinomycetota bacterium]